MTIEWIVLGLIIVLVYLIYKLNSKNEEYNSLKRDYKRIHDLQEAQQKELFEYRRRCYPMEKLEREINEARVQLNQLEQYKQDLIERMNLYIKSKCESYPHLAGLMADMLTRHYEKSSKYLQNKRHPAIKEACRINELQKETKEIIKQKKICEYKLEYIRALHPNIDDYFDPAFDATSETELETIDTTDRVRLYLDVEEYRNLSVIEKNQLALDRYIKGKKQSGKLDVIMSCT